MDIEKAKQILYRIDIRYFLSGITEQSNYIVDKANECNTAIEVLLNELDKKEKIINAMKWKPISKYNRKEYDWVLVKYFDGDYECVPDVAEKRSDDRWYNSSGEIIPFEVKYFFDMQMLDYFTKKAEGK